jgi:hypothetical protein
VLKKVATRGGVLAIALVGFFAARAITDAVDGERSSPPPKRPKVYGIAAAPAPEPPDWPAEKRATPTGRSQTGETGGGTPIVETPVQQPETTYPSEVHETPPPDPKPPSSDSAGSKQEDGSSSSGIEEEVGG